MRQIIAGKTEKPRTSDWVGLPGDPDGGVSERFYHETAKRGALIHPRLNHFVSAAHDEAAIEEVISIVDDSLAATPVIVSS